MMEFRDFKKVSDIPNLIFPLVITTTVWKIDVSRISIDGGSSCDIIYSKMFEKMGMESASLWSYEGSDLQVFNWTTTFS